MKFIDGMTFINIGDKIVAVSTGEAVEVYKGIIDLNQSAYEIWQEIENGFSPEEIASHLSKEYDNLNFDEAHIYIKDFIARLMEKGILIDD